MREPLGEVRLCHCDFCRRANGSAFSANSRIPVEQWEVSREDAPVTEYQSSPGAWRAFCSVCGSPVYARVESDPGHIRVRLGTMPRDTEARVVAHVWLDSKASWDEICDDLPRYGRAVA